MRSYYRTYSSLLEELSEVNIVCNYFVILLLSFAIKIEMEDAHDCRGWLITYNSHRENC